VYPDRLAIWNPGELPEGWSMKKLCGHHSSHPYNPLVANAFFRAGEIEAWGRGIERIIDACREAGAPEPRIEFDARDVWVTFPFPSEYLAIVPPTSEVRDGGRPESRPESDGKTPVETSVKASVKTSVEILKLLQGNPDLTLAQVAQSLGRSVRAIELASSKLVKSGRLKYVGPQKGGHWEVLK
jgi:ATP-dependent DNA helicase RecG